MHCPNCGSPAERGQSTCEECGADLRTQSEDARPREEQPRDGQGGQQQGQGGRPQGQGGQQQGQGGQGGQPRGQGRQGGQPQRGQGGQGGRPQRGQGGQGGQPQGQGGQPPGGQPPGGQPAGRQPGDDGGLDRRTLLAGGGVVAALVAGGGLFVFLQGDDGDDSPDTSMQGTGGGSPDTPGNSFATAPQISSGQHGPYELTDDRNHDFAIDLESGDRLTVTISFTHADGDLDLELYDSSELITSATSFTDDETLTHEADATETHYITVYGHEGATNSYELDVQVV